MPAAVVILGHLAWVWNQHPSSSDRQAAAFDHGLAVAAILAATLAAGRIALWMEGRARYPWADTLAVIGAIAILGHLAVAWRDEGVGDVSVAVVHAAALGAWLSSSTSPEPSRNRAPRPNPALNSQFPANAVRLSLLA